MNSDWNLSLAKFWFNERSIRIMSGTCSSIGSDDEQKIMHIFAVGARSLLFGTFFHPKTDLTYEYWVNDKCTWFLRFDWIDFVFIWFLKNAMSTHTSDATPHPDLFRIQYFEWSQNSLNERSILDGTAWAARHLQWRWPMDARFSVCFFWLRCGALRCALGARCSCVFIVCDKSKAKIANAKLKFISRKSGMESVALNAASVSLTILNFGCVARSTYNHNVLPFTISRWRSDLPENGSIRDDE